jgi:hypothetical protein
MASVHTTTPELTSRLQVALLSHLILSAYFLAKLAKDFFGDDQRDQNNIYLIAGHLLEAVGGTVINAFLMFVLRRRHYDTSLLWAYIVCVTAMNVGCVVAIGRSIQFGVSIINGDWTGKLSKPALAVAIIVSILLLLETVFQVRLSLNTISLAGNWLMVIMHVIRL